MSKIYFYIIKDECGAPMAEYVSSALPPQEGAIMNLRRITSRYNDVEVIQVKEFPLPGHTIVAITARPKESVNFQ